VPRGDVWAGAGSAFAPRSVSREKALETARELTPVGMAAREPIK